VRVPGRATLLTLTPKALLRRMAGADWISGIIDDAERYMPDSANPKLLRPGLALGYNTNDGKWYICWCALLTAAEAAGQTTLSVTTGTGNTRFTASDPDGSAFNVKIIGPGGIPGEQDLGAVTGVAASTITITNSLNVEYPANSYVYRSPATDYDQDVAQGILWDYVSVDDGIGGDTDVQAQILVRGVVDESELDAVTDLQIGQLRDATVGAIAHELLFES
jgi:hypothetical protein